MKPKIAFFSFTSCEGCQLTVLTLEEKLLELLEHVDVVAFREAMDNPPVSPFTKGGKRGIEDYDIAFVEGSITRQSEIPQLEEIRKRAKILIAFGACATTGGVNYLKNYLDMEQVKRIVYKECADKFDTIPTMPLEEVVKVDYRIEGCPIDRDEFVEVTKSLLLGRKPRIPTYPVCVECKLRENVCVFDKGLFCLGPITRAGCKAICPTYGNGCEGCRGLIDDPNTSAHINVLKEHGMTAEEAIGRCKLFLGKKTK